MQLSGKTILLTNDDGIDAGGIASLHQVLTKSGANVWTVAPAAEASQIGHRVTTTEPLRYEERGVQRFAVYGTPADCTRVGVCHLLPTKPDWVFSGINRGGNLGRHDFVISGTVAAAREAAFLGIPAIAFSQFMKRELTLDWEVTASYVSPAWQALQGDSLTDGEFWNINFPHLPDSDPQPGVEFCDQESGALLCEFEETDAGVLIYRGDYQRRPQSEGSDVRACFGGNIAISRCRI